MTLVLERNKIFTVFTALMGGAQSKAEAEPKSSVSFRINGTSATVNNVNPLLTLNEWLRAQPGLAGTKKMCGEGGCGCCVVAATRVNPATQKEATIAINSVRKTSAWQPLTCQF